MWMTRSRVAVIRGIGRIGIPINRGRAGPPTGIFVRGFFWAPGVTCPHVGGVECKDMHLTKYRRGYDDSQVTSRRLGGSFTIPEWCEYRRLSISMFYKLRAQGKAPATLPVGRHQTITAEADAAWARKRQAETNT